MNAGINWKEGLECGVATTRWEGVELAGAQVLKQRNFAVSLVLWQGREKGDNTEFADF